MRNFSNSIENTPFNSSLAFLERVERRWEDCDNAKLEGDIIRYFRSLETIYRNTHPFFNEEECEDAETLVYEIENLLSNGNTNYANLRFAKDDVWVGENKCDLLRMMLVKLLFKYKITYYKVNIKKWEDELKEDYE